MAALQEFRIAYRIVGDDRHEDRAAAGLLQHPRHLRDLLRTPQIALDDDLVGHAHFARDRDDVRQRIDVELVVDVDENPVPDNRQHLAQRRHGLVGRDTRALDDETALLKLGQRAFRELALAGRGAVEPAVMEDDEDAVARFLDVELDHLGAEFDRGPHGGDRVFRMAGPVAFHAAAAMRHDHHMVAPAVGVLKPLADFIHAAAPGGEGHGLARRQ